MLDWGISDAMDADGMDYHNSGQGFSVDLDIPSDNDVSCMVEKYLPKDTTTRLDDNGDNDWATVLDDPFFRINHADHHVSLSGPMNSDLNFNGMYSNVTSENSQQVNSLSGHTHYLQSPAVQVHHQLQSQSHHQAHQHQQQQQQHQNQNQPPTQLNSSYDCYQHDTQTLFRQGPVHDPSLAHIAGGVSYLNVGPPFTGASPPEREQYSQQMNQPNLNSQNNGAYYDSQAATQHHEHFSQTSPVYYVAQTVGKIPAPDNMQNSFNFEQYASYPGAGTPLHQSNNRIQSTTVSRNHSSSSGGNSPSSQSPVSEESYHEPIQVMKVSPNRRKSEPTLGKKPKAAAKQRRRKKDPNEPTKPVSAYALFFRDKQANIKGSKPDATFGEVSKIVAQMWETLEPEKKAMYKKRTEEAKKDYLQQLAVYRASQLSTPDSSMYIQSKFVSRSSPVHMPNYNRTIYSAINTNSNMVQNNVVSGHAIKTHLQTFPGQSNLMSRSPPMQRSQEDCHQRNQSLGNEIPIKMENNYGHVYGRILDSSVMGNGYITPIDSIWEPHIVAEGDALEQCKQYLDEFP